MAAVTGVITAVVGLGLTAYGMYEADEKKKAAKKAEERAKNRAKSLQDANMYDQLQAPDVGQMTVDESIAQGQKDTLVALQGMGVEGAGQVTKLEQQARGEKVTRGRQQMIDKYQIDSARAQENARLKNEENERERARLEQIESQARIDQDAADQAMLEGTSDLVAGLGNVATGMGKATSLEAKAQRQEKKELRGGLDDDLLGINSSEMSQEEYEKARDAWNTLSMYQRQ